MPDKIDINQKTRLYEDLGVTGDDAYDLLIKYSKIFRVDISKFMFSEYFSGEGMNMLSGNGMNKKTLTVRFLEKGILAGELSEMVINS